MTMCMRQRSEQIERFECQRWVNLQQLIVNVAEINKH